MLRNRFNAHPAYALLDEGTEPNFFHEITRALAAEALFVSSVQPSDNATGEQIRLAVTEAIHRYGSHGCAELMGFEFGDHPDTAVARMGWASAAVTAAFTDSH